MPTLARIEDWLSLGQMCCYVLGTKSSKDDVRFNFCCMKVVPGQPFCKKHGSSIVITRIDNSDKKEGA